MDIWMERALSYCKDALTEIDKSDEELAEEHPECIIKDSGDAYAVRTGIARAYLGFIKMELEWGISSVKDKQKEN